MVRQKKGCASSFLIALFLLSGSIITFVGFANTSNVLEAGQSVPMQLSAVTIRQDGDTLICLLTDIYQNLIGVNSHGTKLARNWHTTADDMQMKKVYSGIVQKWEMPTGQRTFRYGTQAEDAVLRALWLLKRYFFMPWSSKSRHAKEVEAW